MHTNFREYQVRGGVSLGNFMSRRYKSHCKLYPKALYNRVLRLVV